MRIAPASALLALFLSLPLALAAPAYGQYDAQTPIDVSGAVSVPGENPLTFCDDPGKDILTIERVDLTPNPPVPGKTLTIQATGTFSEKIEKGAKVLLQVKYGLIRLINQEEDLCDQLTNVDLKCPLEEGKMSLVKEVKLPKEIPPGKYTVLADVFDKNKKRITCLEAGIQFNF